MKKIMVLLSILLVAGMVLVGTSCSKSSETESSETGSALNINPSFLRYGTLQGKIMNAITGEAIGGDDLEIYLIQGTDLVAPDKLIKDTTDNFVGEYAFASVPIGIDTTANLLTFKLVVIKSGYQRFESNVTITATLVAGGSGGNEQIDNTFTNEMFNTIGNIYLYPLGSFAGDVTVYVRSPQQKPIPSATVLLQQNVTANNTIANNATRLVAAGGLYPSLTATTDTEGKVVFSGTQLTLGGSYRIVVEALTFEGQQLATATPAALITGVNNTTQVVNMAPVTTPTSNSLYATYASNQVPGTITDTGVLTITFSQPVVVDTTKFSATATHGALAATPVTASLSSDGLTLTLTPSWTTEPASTDKGVQITYTYTGGVVYLQNAQAAATYTLFGGGNQVVNITTGTAVSGLVQMTSQ